MPGLIPHLLAGSALFFVGRYGFPRSFDGGEHSRERYGLLFVCILFSIIPDVVLGVYYSTNILPFETLLPYHNIMHLVLTPVAILGFLVLAVAVDGKWRPVWLMGICAIVLHVVMDQFISEFGVFI